MVEAHVCVWYFLTVWVALGNEICHVDGELFSPVTTKNFEINNGDVISQHSEPSEPTELKLVHVLFRHGDRTPDREEMELYPDDPNIDNKFHPYGLKALTSMHIMQNMCIDRTYIKLISEGIFHDQALNQTHYLDSKDLWLTKEGKARQYKVGEYLRQTYKVFLNSVYIPEEIYVRTTDYDRTKMSALACLAGLYPPEKVQQWHPQLMWQPIPYHTLSYEDDDMLYYYTCPRFLEARSDELHGPKFQQILEPYKNFFTKISYYTGRNLTTPEEIFYIDNLFQAEKNFNISPPEWAVSLMDLIREMTVIEYQLEFATDELKRVAGGTLLQKMLRDSYAKIKGTLEPTGRKMFMYSAHENNVAAILACCGVFQPHQPPYGSTFILELHQQLKSKEYSFRILYLKDVTKAPEVLHIPNCGEFCAFDKFVQLTKNTVTSTLKKDCELKHS